MMNFNKREISRIKQALSSAIDSEYDFIDGHRTKLRFVNGRSMRVIPKEHRNIVAQTRRTIKSWQKILNKINN